MKHLATEERTLDRVAFILRAISLAILLTATACASQDEPAPEIATVPASNNTRDDIPCDRDSLPEDDFTEFLAVHYVVDGQLGTLCYGEEDQTVFTAWEQLETITPPFQLNDLSLFGGFVETGDGDSETLAFVNIAEDDGSSFQMSINLDAYDADPDEAALTMAHEFSHVFTSTESQLDRTAFSEEDCDTYYNTEGCFLSDSIMAQWIDLFWGDDLIEEIDPAEDPEPEDGENRCALHGQFLGPYAASNPEEDFAETFSAYVFQVSPISDEVQEKLDWIDDQPGLAEFRERAEESGLGPLDNNFERCGNA